MKATKRDFESLAKIVRETPGLMARRRLAFKLAEWLDGSNPLYNRRQFIGACDLGFDTDTLDALEYAAQGNWVKSWAIASVAGKGSGLTFEGWKLWARQVIGGK